MTYETTKLLTGEYVKGDSCYAIVTSRDRRGSYLELDNGQRAFARGIGNLKSGTRIICTITRDAIARKQVSARTYALARLDSICDLYDYCA